MNKFIKIPVREMTLDPQNKAQVRKLIEMADAKFTLAAKAWESGNNSGDPVILDAESARCERIRTKGEAMLAPLGIKVSYPGLYPAFDVNGIDEYTTHNAVLAALGHPRNWLAT